MSEREKPLAITMGDPSGIGPEIIVKALERMSPIVKTVVIGDPLVFKDILDTLQSKLTLNIIDSSRHYSCKEGVLNIIASSDLRSLPPKGKVDQVSGQTAFNAVVKAIELAKLSEVSAIVTAPINKEALSMAGIKFPGHTEILAQYSGADSVAMMLANEEIRTVLVTIHCSLKNAIQSADFNAQLNAIKLAYSSTKHLGIKQPRIAVAGLNPHAGEGGLFGDEEEKIIIPAIEVAKSLGYDVSGPWPGDTVFMQARRGDFDVVVAQYHDQGLIPIKYMGIDNGVNITLGLPFIRTSPDHGTAFNIAGKGLANPASLEFSIKQALLLVSNKDKDI